MAKSDTGVELQNLSNEQEEEEEGEGEDEEESNDENKKKTGNNLPYGNT